VCIISGTGTDENILAGNFIGTDTFGINPLGNTQDGIALSTAARNQVGGSTPTGNRLAFNAGAGVRIDGSTVTGNRIQANRDLLEQRIGHRPGRGRPHTQRLSVTETRARTTCKTTR